MMVRNRAERGAALLIAIAATTTLVAILVAAAATQRVVLQQTRQRVERIRAREAAMAGVQRALADISTQYGSTTTSTPTAGSTTNLSSLTTLQDDWAVLGSTGAVKFIVGDDSFRVQVIDTSGLIDINSAVQAQLERLPLTSEQIDSLLDWRETSRTPRAAGAKDEYYNNLSQPYNAKLGRFDTVDELLQVKGFTGKVLYEVNNNFGSTGGQVMGADGQPPVLRDLLTAYSYAPQLNPQGQAKLNVNTAQLAQLVQAPVSLPVNLAQAIVQRVPRNWTGLGQILALPGAATPNVAKSILNNLQVGGAPRLPGKINLNTATQSTLQSISQLTPDMVQAVISRQTQVFTSLGDLVDIPGFSNTVLRDTVDYFSVVSSTFCVRVLGQAGGTTVALEVMIDVQNNKAKVVGVSEPPLDDMITRWGWAEDTTSETELVAKP